MKETTSTGTPLKLPETGLQPARSFAVIYTGTHLKFYKGQPVINEKSGKQQISGELLIYWELPKFMNPGFNGGTPFPSRVKNQYTLSASPKAKLPDVLKSWGPMKVRPEKIGPDLLKKFINLPCMLNLEHSKDGKYANVSGGGRGVNPWMKDLPALQKYNEPIFFDVDEFTWDAFYKLPSYAQKLTRKSIEFPSIIAKNPEPIKADGQAEVAGLEEGVEEIFTDEEGQPF